MTENEGTPYLMRYGRNILILSGILILNSLAINITSPFMPIYIRNLGSTMTELGIVFAIQKALGALLQIPSGLLADKYGRKRIHALGVLLDVFPPLIYLFAKKWTDLISGFMIAGIASGMYMSLRWTIVADDSTTKKRAGAYSWVYLATMIGGPIGSTIGGFIAEILEIKSIFIIAFILLATSFPLALIIKETKTIEARKQEECNILVTNKSAGFLSLATVFSLMNIAQGIGFGILQPTTSIFIIERFNVSLAVVGIVFAIGMSASSIVVQLPAGKIGDKYNRKKIMIITTFIAGLSFTAYTIAQNILQFTILMFIGYGAYRFAWPVSQALIMDLTPIERRGVMNGLIGTSFWIGFSTGSLISGFIWQNLGILFPYYVVGISFLISATTMLLIKNHVKQ